MSSPTARVESDPDHSPTVSTHAKKPTMQGQGTSPQNTTGVAAGREVSPKSDAGIITAQPSSTDHDNAFEEDEFEPEDWAESGSNASTSISSSIYAHIYENGRRFHKYRHGVSYDDQDEGRAHTGGPNPLVW